MIIKRITDAHITKLEQNQIFSCIYEIINISLWSINNIIN